MNTENITFLVIEDEPDVIESFGLFLIIVDFKGKVLWAKTLAEAMHYIRTENLIDCIWCDGQLPDGETTDGTIAAAFAKFPGVKIVSTSANPHVAKKQLMQGCDIRLNKPPQAGEFQKVYASALEAIEAMALLV